VKSGRAGMTSGLRCRTLLGTPPRARLRAEHEVNPPAPPRLDIVLLVEVNGSSGRSLSHRVTALRARRSDRRGPDLRAFGLGHSNACRLTTRLLLGTRVIHVKYKLRV
jgi:hypothetical protein